MYVCMKINFVVIYLDVTQGIPYNLVSRVTIFFHSNSSKPPTIVPKIADPCLMPKQ
jgi:hypothetical protein